MVLLVGLGNHGEKYQNNRHNVGFMFVDYLVGELTDLRVDGFKNDKYSSSKLVKFTKNNIDFVFAKPQTFMNKSGIAIKKLLSNFQTLKLSNLIVAHDDLDIPFGKFHIQQSVGPRLHNGLKSIEDNLKTKDFWRIRVGVDARNPENRIDGITYVLKNFSDSEKEKLEKEIFPKIFDQFQTFLKNQFSIIV